MMTVTILNLFWGSLFPQKASDIAVYIISLCLFLCQALGCPNMVSLTISLKTTYSTGGSTRSPAMMKVNHKICVGADGQIPRLLLQVQGTAQHLLPHYTYISHCQICFSNLLVARKTNTSDDMVQGCSMKYLFVCSLVVGLTQLGPAG